MRRLPASLSLVPLAFALNAALAAEIDPVLRADAGQGGRVDALIVFGDQSRPALTPLDPRADYRERRRALVDALRARAGAQQADARAWLDARGIAYRPYWIVNVISVRLDANQIDALAQREDIARIAANRRITVRLPQSSTALSSTAPQEIAWGVSKINAPDAWTAGYTGQGVVIGGQDTGYQWDHPALKAQYRGWNGGAADHNRNWHDAIHDPAVASCPADSPAPCDDYGHGTHTAGTFAGDDGAGQQIGVAPGARWIGCRNMNSGNGTPATYIECMQWLLAPTDLTGANPDPDLAPDIVNNSWGCVPEEGCTVGDELQVAVDNLVAAGVFFVVSAGNDGAGCGSITTPAAIYDASFVVGATTTSDAVWSASSRGPVTGSDRIRPDLAAPGVDIPSAVPGSGYGLMSGTSMAGPHVAGTAALMMSANPSLRGHPDRIAALLRSSASTSGITSAFNPNGCGGLTMSDWPNHQAGYGRLDAWAAVQAAVVDADRIFVDGFDG